MAAITFTTSNFDAEVLQSDRPVLVDFWAAWCVPCHKQNPILEEPADEETSVKIGKLDVNEEIDIAEKYGIMSVPTAIIFKNGGTAAKSAGLQSKESLRAMIESQTRP